MEPGLTFAIDRESGNWSSRAIPNASRIVEVRIDMQHTKIAAETTSRYSVVPAFVMTSAMITPAVR